MSKQANLQAFGKSPLPKGYSTSHILTYRYCEYKFLLSYIYKVNVEPKFKPQIIGSDVHSDISNGIFISDDPDKQNMLNHALNFLSKMPSNPVFETDYTDKNNPGTFRGTIFEKPFIGTFDVHCVYEREGVDWKTGSKKEDKGEYEIQAYILNELFMQKYKHYLKKFTFVFLKTGETYEAESIFNGAVRKRTETKIKNALASIQRLKFEKRVSFACQWCDYQGMCI